MIRIFQEEMVITILMFTFLAISILIRVLLGAVYQGMIRETDNMAATNNRLLKQCKVKFANCYQLNHGVSNIPVFVDKFLNRLSVGPLSFETLYHLSGQTMLLSVVAAGVGICKSIMDGRMLGEILPFYIASFVGLYLYFSISSVVDIKGKRRMLKVNLVDYLENHLSARIQVTEQDIDMLYGKNYGEGRRQRLSGNYEKNIIDLVPINRGDFRLENWDRAEGKAAGLEKAGPERPVSNDGQNSAIKGRVVPTDKSDLQQGYSAQVTTEELETLLKEFLLV